MKIAIAFLLFAAAGIIGYGALVLFAVAIDTMTPAGIEAVGAGVLYLAAACSSVYSGYQLLRDL